MRMCRNMRGRLAEAIFKTRNNETSERENEEVNELVVHLLFRIYSITNIILCIASHIFDYVLFDRYFFLHS
jgi:hypothetical protein